MDLKTRAREPFASSGTNSTIPISCGTPRGTRCMARGVSFPPPASPFSASQSTAPTSSSFAFW